MASDAGSLPNFFIGNQPYEQRFDVTRTRNLLAQMPTEDLILPFQFLLLYRIIVCIMSNGIMHFPQMGWIYTHGHTADYHQDIRYFVFYGVKLLAPFQYTIWREGSSTGWQHSVQRLKLGKTLEGVALLARFDASRGYYHWKATHMVWIQDRPLCKWAWIDKTSIRIGSMVRRITSERTLE